MRLGFHLPSRTLFPGSSVFQGLLKRNLHTHLARWYSHIESLPAVQEALTAFATAQKETIKGKSKSAAASFELGLPNAVHGKVVTRLPPEPSGYLHIGHAKGKHDLSACCRQLMADSDTDFLTLFLQLVWSNYKQASACWTLLSSLTPQPS